MALSKILENSITDGVVSSAKLKDFAAAVDLNGVELILDADQDTSITADTDDRIDFKLGGVEHISLNNSSGDTVIKPMVDAKDIIFQQYDGNKILEINDGNYVGIGGNAAGAGEIRIYEDTDDGTHYTGFKAGNNTESIAYTLPTADAASSGQALVSNASGVLSWATISANTPTSADGQALGSASLEWSDLFLADGGTIQFGNDQDVTLTHVADTGLLLNSTMQLQFNDASQYINAPSATVLDINATDEIELNATAVDLNATLDVSGTSQFNSTVTVGVNDTGYDVKFFGATSGKSFLWDESADTLIVTGTTNLVGTTNLDAVDIDGAVQLDSTLTVGANDQGYDIIIYGDTASANMTWDTSVDDLIFNGAARIVIPDGQLVLGSTAVTSTAAELNLLDGVSGLVQADLTKLAAVDSTAAELNLLNGVSGLVQADLTKLAAIDATAAEINLIDGGTARGTTAVASGDGLLVNDGGTMRMTNVDTVSTYFSSHNVGGGNIVTTGALASGSIAAGFGAIDNGTSGITTGGNIVIDVDTDANDDTADGSAGRLTIGASGDLNLYHNTNSYIVNKVGNLIFHTETDDTDIVFTGEDGSSGITALTLDMSAAGAAGFNGVVTANAGVVVDNITIDGTEIDLSSGSLTIDSAADISLDADSGLINFKDDGTQFGKIRNISSNLYLYSDVQDKDMVFRGNDGGADVDALTLDMSKGGEAVFNDNIVLSTAGCGVYLGVTTATDANLLDDYEEGTWTPNLGGNTSYNTQVGKYTKVGNMVTLTLEINVNALGTGSTSVIYGAPFTPIAGSHAASGAIGYAANLAVNIISLTFRMDGGNANISNAALASAAGTTASGAAIFGDSARVLFSITYISA